MATQNKINKTKAKPKAKAGTTKAKRAVPKEFDKKIEKALNFKPKKSTTKKK